MKTVFKIGDMVDYSSLVGRGITSKNHKILSFSTIGGEPCAKISNKRGVVSLEHLRIKETLK